MIRLRSSHRRTLILRAARAGVGLALVAGLIGLPGGPASAATALVGSEADGSDATPGDGVCATATGGCTLRAAIEETNALAGADAITFASTVTHIRPSSALPTITDAVTIDGSTLSSVPPFFPAPGVELDGSLAGTADGLTIDGDMTQVRGLAVNRFAGDGIVVTADDVTVAGSFVGTDLLGTSGLGNGGAGIRAVGTTGLVIGGSSFLTDKTIVSDNARGIVITGGGSSTITSALVGTDASTEGDLGNDGDGLVIRGHQTSTILSNQFSGNGGVGVFVEDADDVTLNGNAVGVDLNGAIALPNAAGIELRGGAGVTERAVLFSNIVAANLGVGIRIGDDANAAPGVGVPGVVLRNNAIGTDPGGSTNLGNGGDGILIAGGDLTDGATIGGSLADANRIAFNGGAGVHVLAGDTNERVLGNSIYTNGGLGIDLEPTANNDQQPPQLSALVDLGTELDVVGTLSDFSPSHPYRIEFFGNADCATDAGEGRAFLRQRTVDTDASGDASFSVPVTLNGWQAVTATATNDDGTSEFSNCVELGGGGAAEADLSIEKTATSAPPFVGGSDTVYHLAIANDGPDAAEDVAVTDPLPAGTSFVSANASQGSCGETAGVLSCALGDVASGATATVDLTVVLPDVAGDTLLQNTASVSATTDDPDTSDNAASADITAIARRIDLAVTKSAPVDVIEGHAFDYLIGVSNGGPDRANGVVVTDTLPDEVVFVGAVADQGTCSQAAGTVSCVLGSLPSGSDAQVTVSVTAAAYPGGDPRTVWNTATATSDRPDQDPVDDTATAAFVERPASADLSLAKSDGSDDAVGGQDLTYTLTVHNAGPGDATGVTVTDPLPAGTTFVSAAASQGSCGPVSGVVSCGLGALADGGSATVTLVVATAEVDVDTVVTNTASVDGAEPDPDGTDDSASDSTTLKPEGTADIAISAIDDAPDPVTGGYDVSFRVEVRNLGKTDATGAVLADTLPPGTTFVVPNPNPLGCAANAGVVRCQLGTIPAGAAVSVQLVLDTPAVSTSTQLSNVVAVSSPDDANPANDADAGSTTLLPRQTTFATGFIPPNAGDVLVTDATSTWPEGWPIATLDDPTVGAALVPSGPGGVFAIAEGSCGGSFTCPSTFRHGDGRLASGPRTVGNVVSITPPAAASARNPLIGFLLLDRSIAPFSWSPVRVAFRDAETGTFVRELPWCGWRTPSSAACVVSIDRIYSWHAKVNLDLLVKVRFLRAGSFAVMR